MLPESAELVFFAAFVLAFAFVFAPAAAPRRSLLLRGGAGLAGTITIVAVPTFELVLLTLLTLGVLNAAADGKQPFAVRLKAPVFPVAVFRLGVVVAGTRGLVPAEAGGVLGAMLIGVGLLNVAWGGVAAWLTESTVAAWRYSFMADWGLALCGFGLMVVDGRRAALLVLFSIVLCRLPLYLASPQSQRARTVTERPVNLVVAAALAGSAPFAGFAARVLLLRGATQLFWPLGLVLALGMLLWLPGSLRLGRGLGVPRGRQALGVALVLALNVAVGLYPLPLLEAARL